MPNIYGQYDNIIINNLLPLFQHESKIEKFDIGLSSVSVGVSGANITWDFSDNSLLSNGMFNHFIICYAGIDYSHMNDNKMLLVFASNHLGNFISFVKM